ncbi:MAG: DUF996 domain-containing protein [Candidatus Bathyarchaeia archaeon]
MSIENGRILGGVGALLMFIGIFPYINYLGIIELVGLVLVMVALYNLASYYHEGSIFNNALYGLIIGIVGGVIAMALAIITVLTSLTDFLYTIFPDWNGDWTALSGLTPDMSKFSLEAITPFLVGVFVVFVTFWVFSIISAFFVRRSLGTLSVKSGVGLFSTAGLLLLIGAVLIILFGIGLILIWISALLLAIAFFQIKPQQAQPATSAATPA